MATNHSGLKNADERRQLFQALPGKNLGALWEVYSNALTPEPVKREIPSVWRWQELRPLLYDAARLVPPEEAERRVLMLLNPGLPGLNAVTPTLYAGMQIILPGEVARSHRHTPNAIRFIVEGEGAFTAVNGEKTVMKPGDFVTTPTWVFHDHGNEGSEAVVWLDGLDMPLTTALSAIFYERHRERQQPLDRPNDASIARYGRGFRPTWMTPPVHYSPVINYRYEEARGTLAHLAETEAGSPFDGVMIEYINPLTGGPALPTMDAHLQWIQPGQQLKPHRHTGSTLYLGVEGRGVIEIDGQEFPWEEHDVVVVPSWCTHRHQSIGPSPAILFSLTDSPVLKAFSLYREEAQ